MESSIPLFSIGKRLGFFGKPFTGFTPYFHGFFMVNSSWEFGPFSSMKNPELKNADFHGYVSLLESTSWNFYSEPAKLRVKTASFGTK